MNGILETEKIKINLVLGCICGKEGMEFEHEALDGIRGQIGAVRPVTPPMLSCLRYL